METKQLELFKETDFNEMKTFIKEYNGWYLFDNIRDRKDFSCKPSNRYVAVCKIGTTVFNVFGEGCSETRVAECDKKAKLIGMSDYLKLACSMRLNGNYIYNKKKCKLELKNSQIEKTLQTI
jgi:hypothetical protein